MGRKITLMTNNWIK